MLRYAQHDKQLLGQQLYYCLRYKILHPIEELLEYTRCNTADCVLLHPIEGLLEHARCKAQSSGVKGVYKGTRLNHGTNGTQQIVCYCNPITLLPSQDTQSPANDRYNH